MTHQQVFGGGSVSALPPGELPAEAARRSRQDWDDRIGDAVSRIRAWRWFAFGCLLVTAGSVAGNVYQGVSAKVETLVVVKDGLGDIVAVARPSPGTPPDDAAIAADLKRWVFNARTVYVDPNALRHGIITAYDLVKSTAVQQLNDYYVANEPFARARHEVVDVSSETALPLGEWESGRRTFEVSWVEAVKSLEGVQIARTNMRSTTTLVWQPPKTAEDVRKSGDGIWIIAFSWTER
jgi:type IV secretion system protein VirB5